MLKSEDRGTVVYLASFAFRYITSTVIKIAAEANARYTAHKA
ncbi:MAG: hypothetical protein AAF383_24365 [Cyanobacteria bacterium P01_A01_bin.83]